jgi:cation/acetate symporter
MLLYVLFGGMLATTWAQVVKAALLLVGGALLAVLVLLHFGFNPFKLFGVAAEKYGVSVLQPGTRVVSGQWDAISLGLGLMFGTAAMPHVLMRIYTVRDVKAARLSILYAAGLIGFFHPFVLVIGFGAMVIVGVLKPSRRREAAAIWPRRCLPRPSEVMCSSGLSALLPLRPCWLWLLD